MTTPARQRGILEGITKLKLESSTHTEYDSEDLSKTWVISCDDGSHFPFFRADDGSEEDRVFMLESMKIVEDVVQQAQALPKFPIGSRVKVVASGWGLSPVRVGEILTVLDFKLSENGSYTTYKVADSDGQPVNDHAWEPSFELETTTSMAVAVPQPMQPPQPVPDLSFLLSLAQDEGVTPMAAPTYTALQQTAINVFQSMYDAAVAYRNGETSRLNPDYGICDNIDRFATMHGSRESPMSEVKENLIRQTEIYSGNYTYPVPCPDGGDASAAFSRHGNKWNGPYGLNRLLQLGQLIELIKSDKWVDSMVQRKTPAFRNGLTVGDLVVSSRGIEPTFWVFRRDDESMSPSFHKVGDENDYTDIDLNYIKKVDKGLVKERTVAEFLGELEGKAAEKSDIACQIAELQAQLVKVQGDIALLDFSLASQHKVKRIV